MEPSRELRDIFLGYYHDKTVGDPSVADMFSTHEGTVGIGTDPQEFVVGGRELQAVMRDVAPRQGGIVITPGNVRAYVEGNIGWASDNPTFTRDDGMKLEARMTAVFRREDGRWKAVQFHASFGVPNAEAIGRELTDVEAVLAAVDKERPNLAPAASPEGTLTIIFADMEGSTALNEELGDDQFIPLLIRQRDIVYERSKSCGGSVVKSEGDGFMLAFPSARKGVECAVTVQREVRQLDDRLKVRMGIHTGEPTRHADDFYGRDVAYAARLGTAAAGGEILVSALVKSLVEPSGSYTFEGPREIELKGFDGPQQTYSVSW